MTTTARASRRRAKTATPAAAESEESDAAVAAPPRKRARQPSARARAADDDQDAETEALLAAVGQDTRKLSTQRKRAASSAILAEFTSLDALLSNDMEEKQRKRQREARLQRLRAEIDDPDGRKRSSNGDEGEDEESGEGGGGGGGADGAAASGDGAATASTLARLMNAMEHNMSSLSADDHLFSGAQELPRSQEKFGFVFTPMTEPLPFQCFKATATELSGELSTLYRALQTKDDEELAALLWSRAILMRCLLEGRRVGLGDAAPGDTGVSQPALLPSRIGSWLFLTMSTHSNSHIVKGCLNNLVAVLLSSATPQAAMNLLAGLPCANVCSGMEDMRTVLGAAWPEMQMEWRPTVYDFLNAFRRFGFQDSKRSMSAKSKISAAPKTPPATGGGASTVPFPTLNMQFVLAFLVLSLRTNLLRLDGYDAFSFTMFFLRMQFEHDMHPEIVQLASVCIEELLEVFPALEWRREWAPSLVLRIAGASEGLFDSAAGWLAVARRLPRTTRGTQLTTGLSVYVLQHRIDKTTVDPSHSEKPLKFPIPSGLVLDIVAGIVDDLTVKYAEAKAQKRVKKQKKAAATSATDDADASIASTAAASAPTLDLLCKKVALMDLALQAFLNILTQKEMAVLLKKLDELTGTHKSTMSAKWHELKTLVSLMHRKYSLENLRIGRDAVPLAKAALFVDESTTG